MILPRAWIACTNIISLNTNCTRWKNPECRSCVRCVQLCPVDLLPGMSRAQLHILPPIFFICRKQLGQSGPIAPRTTDTCCPVAGENAAVPRWTFIGTCYDNEVHVRTLAAYGGVVNAGVEGAWVERMNRKNWDGREVWKIGRWHTSGSLHA